MQSSGAKTTLLKSSESDEKSDLVLKYRRSIFHFFSNIHIHPRLAVHLSVTLFRTFSRTKLNKTPVLGAVRALSYPGIEGKCPEGSLKSARLPTDSTNTLVLRLRFS
ncbi:hypothetical protein ACJJTC_000005 [Scirpophaga incertulas]